jgi:hypothetical protein
MGTSCSKIIPYSGWERSTADAVKLNIPKKQAKITVDWITEIPKRLGAAVSIIMN